MQEASEVDELAEPLSRTVAPGCAPSSEAAVERAA
jgi:hypothetical protein